MRTRVLAAAAAAVMVGLGGIGVATAHHGWGGYEAGRTVALTGTVQRLSWGSPHVSLWLRHDGRETEVVLAPPTRMTARGLTEAMIQAGTEVSLDAYPQRDGEAEFRAERIRVAGKTVELR